ncbi:NAD(P)H-dependent flavin oxidoreductase [Pedococcus sp. 2YAF34]|uniref:NAD(P)H-dependent flavin oxidoreductase n=1 Tax=Pedococcus sp. 2YAF34 TaxID=3233032 RepID=UPI003F973414
MTAPDWAARPLVLAPMAGGPSTVTLAAEVARAGVFPFLAGAYLSPQRLADDVAELRSRSSGPFGVNVFAPSPDHPSMLEDARAYAAKLAPWAAAAGVVLGEPRYDDDAFDAKVEVLVAAAPAVVSFAFGWPPAEVVARLQAVGCQVWVTVNDPQEADWARELGVDGLVAQGWEAGGHRGGPVDSGGEQLPVRELVNALRARSDLPLMAAGGVVSGAAAAELLELGATAVAMGTVFLACPEAGTAPVHVDALTRRDRTVVTRAFTGRSARALATTWTDLFTEAAPAAYPHVHHVTAPLRAHGKATGEAELVHLWAGAGHAEVRALPAAELAALLVAELAAAKSR